MEINSRKEEFESERPKPRGGSAWWACALIIFNGTVGGGLLNIPASVIAAGGFLTGFICLTSFACFAIVANAVLGWCSDIGQAKTYQETVRTFLGTPGELVSAISLFFLMFIGDVYIFVGIADMIERVMLDSVSVDYYCSHWFVQRLFLSAMISLFILLPPCLVMHIDKLKYISGMAVISIGCVVGVTMYEYYSTDIRADVPTSVDFWPQVFLAIPGITIAFSNQYSSVSVYARQKPHTLARFIASVTLATAMASAVYIITSIYCCLLFGNNIAPNFTTTFKTRNWPIRFAFLSYTLKLCFEYPVVQYVGWTCLESFLHKFCPSSFFQLVNERFRRWLASVLWVGSCLLLGSVWSNIAYFSPFVSALVFMIMAVFPGLCLIQGLIVYPERTWQRARIFMFIGGALMTAIGAFLIGVVLTQFAFSKTNLEKRICN